MHHDELNHPPDGPLLRQDLLQDGQDARSTGTTKHPTRWT